jgi:oligopeptide transport system ATP-binding protein
VSGHLLDVRDLSTHFFTHAGVVKAVNGVSFTVDHGETLAIVGESGCGKTAAALSLMGLVPDPPGRVVAGSVRLGDRDLRQLPEAAMQKVRGNDIAMVFQDPMTSLNPVVRVGKQIAEAVMLHQGKSKSKASELTTELLARVGIPDPVTRASRYPFELSGGMRQRVMIAMAISCNPDVLIADEPTTALDVTIQAQIIDVVREMQSEYRSGVVLITHDLGVVAEIADKVMVMYGGRVMEYAPVHDLFRNPHHPYTWGLLGSLPRLDRQARLTPITGQPPDLIALPPGCPFAARCAHVRGPCRERWPALEHVSDRHGVHCWIPADERVAIGATLEGERTATA